MFGVVLIIPGAEKKSTRTDTFRREYNPRDTKSNCAMIAAAMLANTNVQLQQHCKQLVQMNVTRCAHDTFDVTSRDRPVLDIKF